MEKEKTQSQSIILLFERSMKKELLNYIDQMVEEKFNQLLTTETESKTLLDANEVCKKYKISKSSLERYIRKDLKFSSQSKGGKRLFKQKDLENYFENKNANKQRNRNNGR